jgi:ABC-type lipoprotein release transport system permease subunit
VAWDRVLDGAEQRVLAVTRNAQAVPASPDMTVVGLEREWQPDELRDRALQEQRTRFRTGWVIAISLVVTVIGISNAMLMSVTERFREIGTMKCLGALSQFIRQVFFLEACVVGLAGSTAGCVFGAAFAAGAYSLSYGVELVAASMAPSVLLLHGGVCVAAGLVLSAVAAIYPAGVASRMLPAVALRSTV